MFTDKEHRGAFELSDELEQLSIGVETSESVVGAAALEANDKDLLLSVSDKEDTKSVSDNGSAYNAPAYDGSSLLSSPESELAISNSPVPVNTQTGFAIDDLLGLGMSLTSAPLPPPALKLNAKATLDPGTFQQKWRQHPIAFSQVLDTIQKPSPLHLRLITLVLPYFPISVSYKNIIQCRSIH